MTEPTIFEDCCEAIGKMMRDFTDNCIVVDYVIGESVILHIDNEQHKNWLTYDTRDGIVDLKPFKILMSSTDGHKIYLFFDGWSLPIQETLTRTISRKVLKHD